MIIPINQYLVPLTQGKFAVVDAEGWEKVKHFKWHFNDGYALRGVRRNGGVSKIRMHRFLMDTPKGMDTDHINGDKLDNRYCNLRVCSHHENIMNRQKSIKNTSGYIGVSWHKNYNKWSAQINIEGKKKTIGYYDDKIEAARDYNKMAIKYRGEFARLNDV